MDRFKRNREGLDLKAPLGRGYDLRLVERPGRRLDPAGQRRLIEDLRAVAAICVPDGPLTYGILSGDGKALDAAVIAMVYEPASGRPVGFNAMAWYDGDFGGRAVLHAGLCMILPEARRSGLLGVMSAVPALVAFLRNGLRPLWVTNVTQVPAVAGLFAGSVGRVYPSVDPGREPDEEHTAIAHELMACHRHVFGVGKEATFDPHTFVIGNAYTGGSDALKKSFVETGKHRDPRMNSLCRDLLDYQRGDDLLQVGRLTVANQLALAKTLTQRVIAGALKDWGRRMGSWASTWRPAETGRVR